MKTELKRELFQSAINLCTFVNEHQITKENIQTIIENSGIFILLGVNSMKPEFSTFKASDC